MKNYKKALGVIAVIAAMPLMAQTTIKVTTFDDEDNENMNACSLREAITAAEMRKSYGGCEVPTIDKNYTIQLEAGIYTLNKELTPKVALNIIGKEATDWERKGVLTNDYPAQKTLQTHINAGGKSRIFNTAVYQQPLALTNIILENGKSTEQGGAIYAGADITLKNSQILNSQAPKGGAIYLGGSNASLTMNHSLIQGNGKTSIEGSILAMSCMFNNTYSSRTLSLDSNSFIDNGATDSISTFDFCGSPTATFTNNTIAKNIASLTNGSILKFTGDADPSQNQTSNLSSSSSLALQNNTIVENSANTTFLYDKLGKKDLNFNVLAFNKGSYACKYLLGAASAEKDTGLNLKFNALNLTGDSPKCDVPTELIPTGNTNIDIKNEVFSALLEPLKEANENNGFLPIYYPKNNFSATDLIDVDTENKGTCQNQDQRGLSRLVSNTYYYQTLGNIKNSCDIGSIELMKLTAGDLEGLGNISFTNLLDTFQKSYDLYDGLLKDSTTPSNFIVYYKVRLAEFKDLLDKFKNDTAHVNTKYRAIYIDLKNYGFPLPSEDTNHVLNFFNTTDYSVKAEPLGVGQKVEDLTSDTETKKNQRCEWNPTVQQILFYRVDDDVTSNTTYEFCKYTITTKTGEELSSGLIKAKFANIAPVSGDGTISFKYLANEIIPLNLLKYANDDGDGPVNTLSTKPNKSPFWVNDQGTELPIYLPSKTSKDGIFTVVKADREGPCPGKDSKNTCYGGNIYIQAKNVFNTFNDTLTYYVYDADGTISAKAGTINLVSTATTTDDSRSGGGGSIGIFSLASLLSLIAYRRYRK
ncbi:CSLREA domain-containing protein [Acinetobacter nosocomialis]|uniref:CSLREA domain-containing protein n=1 Tax=Acinetobacter nosocomialis TaxID=106654 RepID=UPI0028108E54|nr:CSLREA domain-containing protein [Acinetobacter nosocomialis]MDQ9029418.1 CSLREA domain-containing protein [Acinetobacter nosocomialis]MDQ9046692.1 CSLREA domain-containing protein [Acinetobacter nosocomialis]MDQ9084106.1 CSLREA domain-containing protein [Acinetobacter nosocomialis]